MHISSEKLVRFALIFLAVYLIGDGLIHFLNIKLQTIGSNWPQSAVVYAKLLNAIYSSFVFLVAMLALIVQKDIKKYQDLIKISPYWAIFHGLILLYLSTTINFVNIFSNMPSLYVWMPFYNQYLFFEAVLAFIYAVVVFVWNKK